MAKHIKSIRTRGLFSISGFWLGQGKKTIKAMDLALVSSNEYMSQRGPRNRYSSTNFETKIDLAKAKNVIKNGFTNSGVKIFIGPK